MKPCTPPSNGYPPFLSFISLYLTQNKSPHNSIKIKSLKHIISKVMAKNVMVAIDESECSQYALEWALDTLSDSISSSSLFIFTAQPITDLGHLYADSFSIAVPPEYFTSIQEQQARVAAAILEKAKEICLKRGITPQLVTEVGEPRTTTCEAVEKYKIDILVLGSHGKGVLKRAFLGSVSNYCVQHAKCPVLVVRKPE